MLRPGETLAGYRIEGILGHGGMGTVYEAVQLSLDRPVALKVLDARLGADGAFRERFRREGLIQARMDHPHIVPIYEAGERDGQLFLAMRLVRGPTLREVIDEGSFDRSRTLEVIAQVADALDGAHARGLVHRDVKPQNILIDEASGRVFLADFGLTKGATGNTVTREGSWVGTPSYMSPEQIRGERATAASDVYALTAVLVECLTGTVPFPKDSESAVLFAHVSDPPPRVSERRAELPAAIDAVIAQGLAKDPGKRPRSARALVAMAQEAFEGNAGGARGGDLRAGDRTRLGRRRQRAPFVRRRRKPAPDPTSPGDDPTTGSSDAPATAAAPSALAPTAARATPPDTAPSTADDGPPAAPDDAAATGEAEAGAATAGTPPAADPTVTSRRPPKAPAATVLSRRERRPAPGATVLSQEERPSPAVSDRSARAPIRAGAAAAAAVLALGVAGFLAGRSGGAEAGGSDAGGVRAASVDGAGARIAVPAGWRRGATAPTGKLGLDDEVVLAGPGNQTLVAGRADVGDGSSLPEALSAKLRRPAGRGEPVSLGSAAGYRFAGLAMRGVDAPMTVYTLPTSAGVVTLACVGSAAGDAACDRVAATASVQRGRVLPLEGDDEYAGEVDAAMTKLNGARARTRRELRAARTSRGQALRGRNAAAVYAAARRSLARRDPPAGSAAAHRALLRALEDGARAHRRLAAAARGEARGEYRSASAAVARADRRLAAAVRRLNSLRAS